MDKDITKPDTKIAVLIDAENISEKYAKYLLDEVTNYGVPTYKRIYGDWTNPQLTKWKSCLLTYSFTPIQQYSYTTGKNASDSAMIIDAMDILYSGKVDGFCLVSSDSDFTRLAMRLREAGMLVLGMGERKTPEPFIKSCEKFIYLEVLKPETRPAPLVKGSSNAQKETPAAAKTECLPSKQLQEVNDVVIDIVNSISNDDGWAYLADVGNNLNKRMPDFDSRNFGFTKFSGLVDTLKGLEVSKQVTAPGSKANHILIKVINK